MKILYDTIINILASAIIFLFGYVFRAVVDWIRDRNQYEIWKLLKSKENLFITLSLREGPSPTSTRRTSIEEALALAESLEVANKLHIKYEIASEYPDNVLSRHNNILAIGGPAVNKVTAMILDKYKDKLPVKIVDDPTAIEVGHSRYIPTYNENNTKLLTDYAVIMAIRDKNNMDGSARNRIVVMGLRGYGTRGALNYLKNKALVKTFKRHPKNDSFICVVRLELDNEQIVNSAIEEFYSLEI